MILFKNLISFELKLIVFSNFTMNFINPNSYTIFSGKTPVSFMNSLKQCSPSLLRFTNTSSVCGGDEMMASKLADYWSSQLAMGLGQLNLTQYSYHNQAAHSPSIQQVFSK